MTKQSYVDAVLKGIDGGVQDCQSLIYVRYWPRRCTVIRQVPQVH